MNNADFNTQPNGFPLESNATLGFMQNDYQSAVRALGASLAGDVNSIVTGVVETAGVVSDGWIWYDNDLVFFQGGAIAEKFIIDTTVTAKANQNGDVVDRYFVKKARFGMGANEVFFTSLSRLSTNQQVVGALNMLSNAGLGFQTEIILLSGFSPSGTGVLSGTMLYANNIISVSPYSGSVVSVSNPVYLTRLGEWTTTEEAGSLKFEPKTHRHIDTINRKNSSKEGEIRWIVTNDLVTEDFVNGVGRWDMDGWTIANGANGTLDLSDAIIGLTALQRRGF